ncbi:MAG: hypothetical protein ACXWP5_15345, partial [Bdellovibrionota bacterium]
DQSYVVLNSPILTSRMNHLTVKGLQGRDWKMDLSFRRTRGATGVEVINRVGNVRVLTVK